MLAALPKEFYADGFNPLDYIFSCSPEDFDEVWLNQQIEEKEKIKAVVESNLSDRVLTSYGDFGKKLTSYCEERHLMLTTPVSSRHVSNSAAWARSSNDNVFM